MTEENYIYIYPSHQKVFFDEVTEMISQDDFHEELLTSNEYILALAKRWVDGEEFFEFHTSGSTGNAKSIIVTRQQIIASINHTASVIEYLPNQNCLLCLNPRHVGGAMVLLRALELGMNIYVCPPQVESIIAFFDQNIKIHHASFVPLQIEKGIKNNPSTTLRVQIENIKSILVGGSPINKHLEEVLYSFKNEIYQTYGMTETCSNIALRKLSKGVTEEYYTIFDGIEIGIDERNCLKIKGDITNNIWLQTNDIADLKNTNKIKFIGRADFVINTGGIKINPEILEQKLAAQIQNRNYIISSKPDDRLGQRVVLLIEGDEKIDLNFDNLAAYEKPKEVLYITGFPKTDSGKLDRITLKKLL